MIGVTLTFQYNEDFDHARVVSIADNARATFEGMPRLRSKVFTIDDARQRAMNFYIWESADAAKRFFSEELRERVTGPVRRRTHDRLRRDSSTRQQLRRVASTLTGARRRRSADDRLQDLKVSDRTSPSATERSSGESDLRRKVWAES